METPSWPEALARALSRARWIILAPALAGIALFLLLGGAEGEPGMAALAALALGLGGASIAAWVMRLGIDSAFLPQLVQTRGLDHAPVASHPYRLLAEGVLPEGNNRMMRNLVSGTLAGRRWQAGFLEIGRKQQNGRREMQVFSGQLLQIEAGTGDDFILLPARRRPAAFSGSIGTFGLPQRGEVTVAGKVWQIYAAGEVDPQALQDLLTRLPAAPPGTSLRAVVRMNGWYHLIHANRRDLFRLGDFLAYWRPARAIAQRVFDRLAWAELTAQATLQDTGAG